MNWIKVTPLHRLAARLAQDAGLTCVKVESQSPLGPKQITTSANPGDLRDLRDHPLWVELNCELKLWAPEGGK